VDIVYHAILEKDIVNGPRNSRSIRSGGFGHDAQSGILEIAVIGTRCLQNHAVRNAYIRDTSRLVGERGHVSAFGTYHDAAGQFCPYLAALNLHVINRTNGFGIVTNLKRDAIVVGAEHAVCN